MKKCKQHISLFLSSLDITNNSHDTDLMLLLIRKPNNTHTKQCESENCCIMLHCITSCRPVSHHIPSHQGHITSSHFISDLMATKQCNDIVTQDRWNNTTQHHGGIFLLRIIPLVHDFTANSQSENQLFLLSAVVRNDASTQCAHLLHLYHKYGTQLCKRLMKNESICSTKTKHSVSLSHLLRGSFNRSRFVYGIHMQFFTFHHLLL